MTTRDPGASEVFTHGLDSSPASTARLARRPAAIITVGFEVFVQLVMAAMTTEPCRISALFSFTGCAFSGSTGRDVSISGSSFVPPCAPPSSINRPTSVGSGSGSIRSRNASMNDSHTPVSGTRSCGRLGPAIDGSTLDRSRSRTSLNTGSGSASVRNSPCSFAYRSTRSTRSSRPVNRRYRSVSSSTGQKAEVAPYSGHMFESVARSASSSVEQPGPKNSTNLPTTPCARSIWVSVSTRSVAVVPAGRAPETRTPTTIGCGRSMGCPSMAASASMPPTPHPSTPRPLIIVVWESVPTSVSGNASPSFVVTTLPRCSRFTWWQIPAPGGTTRTPSKACWAHRRSAYRSPFRRYSQSMLAWYAWGLRNRSTWTEWSMMRSTSTSGLTRSGSPPARAIADRIAARSTTAGTPVKSCIRTRAGMKATLVRGAGAGQSARARTSASLTSRVPARRRRSSSRIFTVCGNRPTCPIPCSASQPSRLTATSPWAVANRSLAAANSVAM